MKLKFKLWVSAIFVVLGFSTANAQVDLEPKFHKFGAVTPGKAYHLKVKIKNPTGHTISLWNLRADCDCTTAHIAQAVLKPKTSTTLAVDYHPMMGENGFKSFTINFQVYSEDKTKAITRTMEKFMFSAELHSPFVFDPVVLEGGYGMTGHAREIHGTMKLDNKVYATWKPDQAQASPGGFQAQVKALPTPGLYGVVLSMPSTLGPGNYSGMVTLTGQGKTTKASFYPFHVTVGSLWNVVPNRLELGLVEEEALKNTKWNTQIRETYGKPFKIVKVDGLPDWLAYHLGKSPAGDAEIQWELDKGKLKSSKDGTLDSELTVQTDLKEEPDFKIHFHAVKTSVTAKAPATSAKASPVSSPTPSNKIKK